MIFCFDDREKDSLHDLPVGFKEFFMFDEFYRFVDAIRDDRNVGKFNYFVDALRRRI